MAEQAKPEGVRPSVRDVPDRHEHGIAVAVPKNQVAPQESADGEEEAAPVATPTGQSAEPTEES